MQKHNRRPGGLREQFHTQLSRHAMGLLATLAAVGYIRDLGILPVAITVCLYGLVTWLSQRRE